MTSGSRLSAVTRRTGPPRQRAAAACSPRAAPTARVKALSGQRRVLIARTPRPRAPRIAPAPPTAASPCAPRPDRLARAADSRLASAAAPIGRVRAPAVRVVTSLLPPPRAPARRPSHHAAVSAPVSRHLPAVSVRRRRAVRRPVEAELGQRRARGPRALRPAEVVDRVAVGCVALRTRAAPRTVYLGRARIRPSCTRLNFINF
jgi:hypothetical protein